MTVPKQATCATCGGRGAEAGNATDRLPPVRGRGVDQQSQGFFSISQPCPRAAGAAR